MAPPRIELADETAEGQMIAEALRALGFYVVERSLESLAEGTDAALLIVAGDARGAVDVLRALRNVDATATTPVVLLGAPPDVSADEEARALGADAYYARPVSVERLVRKVETYLSPRETRLRVISTPPEPESPEPPAAPERTFALEEQSEANWEPRERTMSLADDADEGGLSFDAEDGGEDSFVEAIGPSVGVGEPIEVTGVSWRGEIASIEEAAAELDQDNPISQVARTSRPPEVEPPGSARIVRDAVPAEGLSPRLAKLFSDADRRVFPDSAPLEFVLPAGVEPARALVPDDLLDMVSLPSEPEEEDPLEAFTYVGFVPEVPSSAAQLEDVQHFARTPSSAGVVLTDPARAHPTLGGASRGERPSRPPLTYRQELSAEIAEMGTLDTVGEVAATDDRLAPEGQLGDGDVLTLLARLTAHTTPALVKLELDGLFTLVLGVHDAELVRFDGPVFTRALELLRLSGRIDDAADGERAAEAILDARVRAQTIAKFEADRVVRRARESLLAEALTATRGNYTLSKPIGEPATRVRLLSRSFVQALVEGARQKLSPSDARRLLGGGGLAIVGAERACARGPELGLEPETEALLVRHEGRSLDSLLGAAPPDEGLAGLVLALVALRLLRLEAREASEEPREAARSMRASIEASARLAEDAHYFAVLGVPPTVKPRELRDAYERKRGELRDMDLAARGLDDLEPLVEESLRVIEEAFEVLSDPELASAYRAALEL